MNKSILLAFLLPALPMAGQAKLGLNDRVELGEMLAASAAAKGTAASQEPRVSMFARVSGDAAVDAMRAAGAEIEQREGDIVVLSAPLSKAEAVAAAPGVITASLGSQLNLYGYTNPLGLDFSRGTLGLDKIHAGVAPFSQAYTGKGVIVGIIDAGIDVHHINFKDADGNYRVKRAYKHAVMGQSSVTLTADTPEKMAKFTTDNAAMTHGTHVLGIVGGSFKAEGDDAPDFRGAAPDAELAVSCGTADTPRLIKGLRSIIDYAKSENKPVVVNISMGNNEGPHDGTDEFPAALNNMAGEEGVTICVASGNEGATEAFLYGDFSEGNTTLRSFISPSDYTSSLWGGMSLFPQATGSIEVWSEDDTPFTLAFDLVDVPTGKVISTYTVPANGSGALSTAGTLNVTVDEIVSDDANFNEHYYNSYVMGETGTYAANNRYHAEITMRLECLSMDSFQRYAIAMRLEGKPGQKVYVYGQPISQLFPFKFMSRNVPGYTASNGDGSVSSLAGAKNVITVGSYVTHNFNSDNGYRQYEIGTTSPTSSWGHLPGGAVHPQIKAPGTLIVSSMSSDYVNGSDYNGTIDIKYYSHTDGGKTYFWTPMSGTSMASPFMSGVAATWLSADPDLTTDEIRSIAQETSDAPSAVKDNDGVSGNLNAYRGLCKILNLSGINNVTADSKGAITVNDLGSNRFSIQAPAAARLEVSVVSMGGAKVFSAASSNQIIDFDGSSLQPGVYVLSATDGLVSRAEKIVIR